MLFNSPEFLFAFLPLFFIAYFSARPRARNGVLFAASLFFYFATSSELTVILILSVIANYYLARKMTTPRRSLRHFYFISGVIFNLAPLMYYKYAKFFAASLNDTLTALNYHIDLPSPNPILPIGISFFTFQAISYISDVYMKRITPCRNFIDFGMYHSCFPQLIAGPIVRYEEIETQIHTRNNKTDDIYNGIIQFCFGFGKKTILADNMGVVADKIFKLSTHELGFGIAWIGIIAYTLQIYFDFSGYSDMAIGLGRILGFSYPENFNQPYRALSITEFWRRWHMTLTRWFRDYVYIPLGGNRRGMLRTLLNLVTVFFLCGLWHGAAYTFVVWGLYHGALLIGERLGARYFTFKIPAAISWSYTIIATMVGWTIFRSDTLGAALFYFQKLFTVQDAQLYSPLTRTILTNDKIAYMMIGVLCALFPWERFIKWKAEHYEFTSLQSLSSTLIFLIGLAMMAVNGFNPFIYFRF